MHAALGQWDSYRSGVGKAVNSGLVRVCYSSFSSKASDMPYELFKRLFHRLLSKCNRATKRHLGIPKNLLLFDSTAITVGKTRLPWALFHGERAGIKLHIAFAAATEQPVQVIETVGSAHDGPIGEQLGDKDYILVNDRAYGKIKRFDHYVRENQYFVTRIKENITLVKPHSLKRESDENSNVGKDMTCYLGTPQSHRNFGIASSFSKTITVTKFELPPISSTCPLSKLPILSGIVCTNENTHFRG